MYFDRETVSYAVEMGRLMAQGELSKEAGLFSSVGKLIKRPIKTVEKRVLRGSAGKVIETGAAKANRTMNKARSLGHPELRVHPVSANPMGPGSLRGASLESSGASVARGPASRPTMAYGPATRGPAPVSKGPVPWYENSAYTPDASGARPTRPRRDVGAHTPVERPTSKVAPGPNSNTNARVDRYGGGKTKSKTPYEKPQDMALNKADGGVTDAAGNGEVVDAATKKRKGILPFLWRNRLPVAGLGVAGVGYGAYKAVPWAGRQLAATSTVPLASSGGYGPVAYGYGTSPYGNGTPNMGYGG